MSAEKVKDVEAGMQPTEQPSEKKPLTKGTSFRSTKAHYGAYACYASHTFVGFLTHHCALAVMSVSALVGFGCLNAAFSLFSINSVFSILSINSAFSIGCVNRAFEICF